MMGQNADNMLDTYIDELKSSERTLETCQWSLSRHESRLVSALKTAARINNVCKTVVLDPTRQQATRERIMAVAEQRCWESGVERQATHKLSREKKHLFNMGRLATQFGAVALALTVASGASVAMAAESLPGSPLYPVKRAAESVRLALTLDNGARGKLLLTIAQERVEEFNRLDAKSPYRNGLISEIKQDINTAKQIADDAGAVSIAPVLDEFIKENAGGTLSVGKSDKDGEQPGRSNKGAVATPSSTVPGNIKATPTPGDSSTKNEANISNGAASVSKTEKDAFKSKKPTIAPTHSVTSPAIKPVKDSRPSESVTPNGKAPAPSKNSGDVNSGNAPSGNPSSGNKDTGNSNSSNNDSNNNSSNSNSNNNSSNNSSDNSSKSDKDNVVKEK